MKLTTGASLCRFLLSLFGIGLLGGAAYWSLRLAWADHLARQGSPAARRSALELAPGNAGYWVRWAECLDGKEPDATQSLQKAAALNPYDAAVWMELGLRAEGRQDFERAERLLLAGARINKQFEPGWTLANYYFRRQDLEAFWPWTHQALRVAYGDQKPLFRLCWKASQDPEIILSRAIPDRRQNLSQYLSYLVSEERLTAAEAASRRLLQRARREDLNVLLAYCNRSLDAGRVLPALAVWNALSSRKLIPYPALDPEQGSSLTNGDLGAEPLAGGFDWRLPPVAGIAVWRTPPSLEISFSGKQPESCEILWQFLPLGSGRNYRLRFQYRTSEMQPETGLRWRVFDAATGAELPMRSSPLWSARWKNEDAVFRAPAGLRLARLVLCYQRSPGTTRIEGSISLRSLCLAPQPI